MQRNAYFLKHLHENLKRFIPMFLVALLLLTTPSFGSSSGSHPYYGGVTLVSRVGVICDTYCQVEVPV
jgi:hypothetical protein